MKIQVYDIEEKVKFKPVDWRDLFFDSNLEFKSECGNYTTTMNDIRSNLGDFNISEVETTPKPCEHNYEVSDITYNSNYNGFTTEYQRITTYYCKKCLNEATRVKSESQRFAPEWYKGD